MSSIAGSPRAALALAGLVLLAGCAATGPAYRTASLDQAPTVGDVARSTGYGRYPPLPRSGYDRAVAERAAALAARPMTVDDAVEIGLLASPEVRGLLQEFQLQRAGTVTRLAEHDEGAAPFDRRLIELVMASRNLRGEDEEVFLGTWAYGELYAEVAREVLAAANEIRRAYYQAVAAGEAAAMYDRILEAAKAAAELANEQYRSGTLPRLDQAQRQLAYIEIQKDAVAARQAAATAREALNRTLHLPPAAVGWALPERLPDLPAERPEIAEVETFALGNRPDALAAGVRDAATPLGARIAAEARDAYARMLTAYDTARFQREAVLPAAQAQLEEMQLHYNAMLEDVYALLEAAETHIDAGKEYVESLAEFWIARAELADMLGGRLPGGPPTRLAAEAPTPSAELVPVPTESGDRT